MTTGGQDGTTETCPIRCFVRRKPPNREVQKSIAGNTALTVGKDYSLNQRQVSLSSKEDKMYRFSGYFSLNSVFWVLYLKLLLHFLIFLSPASLAVQLYCIVFSTIHWISKYSVYCTAGCPSPILKSCLFFKLDHGFSNQGLQGQCPAVYMHERIKVTFQVCSWSMNNITTLYIAQNSRFYIISLHPFKLSGFFNAWGYKEEELVYCLPILFSCWFLCS